MLSTRNKNFGQWDFKYTESVFVSKRKLCFIVLCYILMIPALLIPSKSKQLSKSKYIISHTALLYLKTMKKSRKMFVGASHESTKDLFVPWCCPPKEIKLTIGGDGQRWATALLKIQKEINACLVSFRSVFPHGFQLQPQMKSKKWNR